MPSFSVQKRTLGRGDSAQLTEGRMCLEYSRNSGKAKVAEGREKGDAQLGGGALSREAVRATVRHLSFCAEYVKSLSCFVLGSSMERFTSLYLLF